MCGKIISIDKSYIPYPYKEREGRGEETFVEFHNICRKKMVVHTTFGANPHHSRFHTMTHSLGSGYMLRGLWVPIWP